jgi:SAM-dependent methyltransferase
MPMAASSRRKIQFCFSLMVQMATGVSREIIQLPEQSHLSLERGVGGRAFGLDPEGYHAARLPYPHALYDELFSRISRTPSILEIGAGTGLVTQALLARDVSAVTAIEPDAALAAFTRRRLADPRLSIVEATFPDVPVEGPFDLIACAAAFHWLDADHALARVRGLLMPSGLWAMWWHSYRNPGMGDELADAISPLLEGIALPPSMSSDRHYSLDEARHRNVLTEAGFRSIGYRLYRTERELTTDAAVSLYKSYSFVRLLPPERRAQFLESLAELVETRFGGKAPNLVLTPLYFATV